MTPAPPDVDRALAHPLRRALLDELRASGSLSAAELARRLRATRQTASWHLHRLADAGLVEQDPEAGRGSERPWRPAISQVPLSGTRFQMVHHAQTERLFEASQRFPEARTQHLWTSVWLTADEAEGARRALLAYFATLADVEGRTRATAPAGALRYESVAWLAPVEAADPTR